MTFGKNHILLLQYGALAVLTAGIFLLDLLTPLGIVLWPVYFLPLVLTFRFPRNWSPYSFCFLVSVLSIAAFVFSPPGLWPAYEAVNRMIGLSAMWGFTILAIRYRRSQTALILTEARRERALEHLSVEINKRQAAESGQAVATAEVQELSQEKTKALDARRRAEEAALASRLRLEAIVHSAMDAIITVNEAQQVVLFNRAAEVMFQWKMEEALGQPLELFIPERHRERHREHVKAFGKSGVTSRRMGALGAITGLRRNGAEFPAEAAISQVAVDGGIFFTVIMRDITERNRVEQALHESERVHRTLLSNLSGMAYRRRNDEEWTMEFASEGCKALTGHEPDQLIGSAHRSLRSLIHPDDWASVRDACRQHLAARHPLSNEYRIRTAEGAEKWVWDQARGVFSANGDLVAVEGFVADVTARKRAEAAFQEAQARFEDIFESSRDAIGYVSLDGKIVLANESFARLTGYTREELMDKTHRDFTPVEYQDLQAREVAAVLQTGQSTEYEREFLRKDGTRVPVAVTLFMVKGDDGKPGGVAAIVRDITERKRAEQSLRDSEQRYRQLVDVSPEAIFINRGTKIVFINRQGLELLGATGPEEVIGRSPFEFIHPDSHQMENERIRLLLNGLEQLPMAEEKFVQVDGTVVDVEVTAARCMDHNEPAIQVVLRDIGQRKRLYEQLRRTERIAELGTLASGMAHEIGTPMNVILGRAEYLMNRTKDEPIKKGLQTIVNQVERITKVMNQLLSFARRRPLERRAVDLKQTVELNLEMFQERLTRYRIDVEVNFERTCPPVYADADQMSQVFINLLVNAIHAMPDGGRVHIAARRAEPEMVEWTIADTGSGMPPNVAEKIFDPFFTTKEFGVGTGLGLTVVKGIMEEHGGSISVESEAGKGTTFTILLPRATSGTTGGN
jgi:PAS domain S-box-containing protein